MEEKNFKSTVSERRSCEPIMKLFWIILFLILILIHFTVSAQGNDFTVIVLPDSQYYSYQYPDVFESQTEWIKTNAADMNIVYVAHVGDTVNTASETGQWENALVALKKLEEAISFPAYPDGIPYGLAVGNHDQDPDYYPVDPITGSNTTTENYNYYFGLTDFSNTTKPEFQGRTNFVDRCYYGGHYGDNNDNHYDLFNAGGMGFIVIYLEYYNEQSNNVYDPQTVLCWADQKLKEYKDRRAIVVSHHLINNYVDIGGSKVCLHSPDPYGTNEPPWNNDWVGEKIYGALKDNPNLFLMLCGHVENNAKDVSGNYICDAEAYREDPVYDGENGPEAGKVYTVMANYHHNHSSVEEAGNGYLRIMKFSPSQDKIFIKTYSPLPLVGYQDDSNSQFDLPYTMPQDSDDPFGSFDSPVNGSNAAGSIAVTGWALDDVGVECVEIYRETGTGKGVYIGDAVLVEGKRPDVEIAYPDYPNNTKAGWGYMLLTNFLPNGGNGTFTLTAYARDFSGKEVILGSKTIIVDNANAVKPFGAIDTPAQGGTASGSNYVVWGWALTPQPNSIPTDGSTINVFVDGEILGQPVYNNYREDIALRFPGYANSNGAAGYFYLDTTTYEDGIHTIYWTVEDSAGNADGIGSRYFSINNCKSRQPASLTGPMPGTKLSDSTETFGWSEGANVSAYRIDVGTSPGGSNIYDGSSTTQHWQEVSNLPTNGETIYVRLSSQIDGTWVDNDYAYEADGDPVVYQPEISLDKTSITRWAPEGQNLSADTFQVRNSGIGTLDYTIGDNKTWLSVSPTGGTSTGEWDTINVNYSTTSLGVGIYSAAITVSAPNIADKTLTVSVTVYDPNSPFTFDNIGEMAGGAPRTRIWGHRGITNADISGGPIAVGRGSDGGEGTGFTAFRWQNGTFVGLPRTGATPYSSHSWAYGISADGSVVYGGDFDNDTASRGVVWTNTGSGWANANTIVLSGSSGWGALSSDGKVTVDYSNNVAYKFTTSDNWATSGGVSRVTLTGMTAAYGCSSDGSVIVGTDASGPAIFNGPNGPDTKVSLPGPGTCLAVSDDGTVVAGSSPTNPYGKDEPCQWVHANGTWEKTSLPLLPGMVPEYNRHTGSAFVVAADGSRIAGHFREYQDYYIPLVWENGDVQKLEDILNSAGVYIEPGWYLADLGTMSPDGMTFGGSMSDQPFGSADNNRHAWIATIDDASGSVLFDSGFETAAGWTFSTFGSFPGSSVFRSTWGTANEHSGSYALALSNQAFAKPITDFIAAGPGSHTISAWVRGEMDDSSLYGWLIRVYFYDSKQQALSPSYQNVGKCYGSADCLSTAWTEKTDTVDAPAGTAYIKIQLRFYMAGGWAAFDDISLDGEPLTVATHGVDGGFETATGWTFTAHDSFPGTSLFRSDWGTANEHSGSYAMALSNQAYATPITDSITAGPGSHTISAWVRGEMDESSFGGWLIRTYFYDSNQQALSPTLQNVGACSGSADCLSTAWTKKTGTVEAPAGTAYIKIKLLFYMAGGWIAYDDITLDGEPLTVATHGVDGGFETATGWTFNTSGSFPGTSVYRSTGGIANEHSGSYALALSNQAYAQPVTDFIAATPGSYTISAWIRGEMDDSSFGGWIIRAFFYDSNQQALSPAYQNAASCTGSADCLSTAWTEKTGTVEAPAGTAYIKIRLYFYMAGGWIAYDDVEILKTH